MTITPIKEIAGAPLNQEQTTYLTGFFAGMEQRAAIFADFLSDYKQGSASVAKEEDEDEVTLTAEERIKNEEHPLDAYYRLLENSRTNKAPDKEETFPIQMERPVFPDAEQGGVHGAAAHSRRCAEDVSIARDSRRWPRS